MRRLLLTAVAVLVLVSAVAGGGGKAKPYALIFGTVWGPDHRPVYGVRVKVRRASEKKARWEVYSNHQGEFAQRVPSGAADYVVWAESKSKNQVAETEVHIEDQERVNIGLHLME